KFTIELESDQSKQRGRERDENMRAQSRWLAAHFPIEADQPTQHNGHTQTQQGIPRGKPCRLPSQPIEHACSATLQRLSVERELPIASSVVGVARLRAALASSLPGAFSSQALCPTRARRIAIGGRSL